MSFTVCVRRCLMPVLVVLVTLGVLASACGGLGSSADSNSSTAGTDEADQFLAPQRGGRLVYGIERDPNGLDPTRNAFDLTGIQVANAIYDPLAAFDESGSAQPYLAKAFEPVAGSDFTAWRIVLRPGVVFHSGLPVDATAVKAYIDAVVGERIDPATRQKRTAISEDAAWYIAATEVVGPLEVLLHMRKPWATFPVLMTGQGGYVISTQQLDDPQGHSVPDGTGPFRLRSWRQGERMELVRNPTYWRAGMPYLDRVDFEFVVDGGARVSALERGAIDVVAAGSVPEVRALDDIVREQQAKGEWSRLRIERDPGPSEAVAILLNTWRKPLDHELVRQALAYATDVEALGREHGWDKDRSIRGPFASTSPWYAAAEMPAYDLGKARALVAEYKQETGESTISFELMGSRHPTMMRQLQEQWAAAGIDVRVTMTDGRKAVPIAVFGGYDALEFRYFSAIDPDSLYHFFTSETRRPVDQLSVNFTRFGSPALDEALSRGRSTTDPAIRREAYATVQRELARHVPYLWLFRSEWVVARSDRVHNARNVTLPDGRPALAFDTGTHRLTETWMAAA